MGSLHFNERFSVCLIHEPCLHAWGEKILYLEASKKKVQITDKFWNGNSLSEHPLVVWYAELSKDGLGKTQQIQSF